MTKFYAQGTYFGQPNTWINLFDIVADINANLSSAGWSATCRPTSASGGPS